MIPKTLTELFNSFNQRDIFFYQLIKLLIIFISEYLVRIVFQLSLIYYLTNLISMVRNICFKNWIYHIDNSGQGDEFPLGELLSRIMNDSTSINELVSTGTISILIDGFFIISCFVSFYTLESMTSISVMIFEVVIVSFLLWGSGLMSSIFYQVRVANGMCARIISDIVGGLTDLYYTKKGNYAIARGEKIFDRFLYLQLKANFWDASYYSFAESIFPILLVFLVFIIPYSNITNLALIAVLIDLIQRSMNPLKSVTSKIATLQRSFTGIRRIEEFLEKLRPHYLVKNIDYGIKSIKHWIIDIDEFIYTESENPFKLNKINIDFSSPGGLYAPVGMSGSGKSTLLNILTLNLIPKNFKFQLDFTDGSTLLVAPNDFQAMQEYRQLVALVTQESHLFSQTLEFNITLGAGAQEQSFDDFWNQVCLSIDYLKVWGLKKSDYLDINTISIGQRQLIAGLRALYFKKKIILLDEIASSLDSQLAAALLQLIDELKKTTIIFMVAHRLETIKGAEQILLLEDGALVGVGTHESLINESEYYSKFIHELS